MKAVPYRDAAILLLRSTRRTVRHHTILVVDDNPQIISLLCKLLAQLNESILIATSGAAALAALATGTPDMILLDIQRPDMSGNAVYQHIKATCDSPVIFTTGADLEEIGGGMGLRSDDYILAKPFDISELLRLIRQCLALSQPAATQGVTGRANTISGPDPDYR